MVLILGIITIFLCLIFAFTNGFNDSANAIATVVASRTLNPRKAVFIISIFEFCGAVFFGRAVAQTIGFGIIAPQIFSKATFLESITLIWATLLGASLWNGICTILGFPISASHSLIGGFIGSGIVASGIGCVQWKNVVYKIIIVMITSPILGFLIGYLLTKLSYFLTINSPPSVVKKFRIMEIISSILFGISHGSNDAAKPMGLVMFTLISLNLVQFYDPVTVAKGKIPLWVMLSCGIALTLGIMFGGKEVIKTIGRRVYKVKSVNSFAAEFGGAAVIYASSIFGFPVSTSHIITSSVIGSGFAEKPKHVGWMVLKRIVFAWIFTLPSSGIFSGILFFILLNIFKVLNL